MRSLEIKKQMWGMIGLPGKIGKIGGKDGQKEKKGNLRIKSGIAIGHSNVN